MKNLFKKDIFWLSVIAAGGLAWRLYLLSLLKSLTFDEIVSFSVAAKPLAQIWSYVKWEMHPPLHYYFLHFWLQLFGATEISAHLSSVFLSVLAIIALYFLGKELFKSGLAGLSAAALYAFSPLFCFYGVWARMYSMLFLFAALSFLFFLKLISARGQKIILFGTLFVICTLAALFSHLTAGIILAIEAGYLIYLVLGKQNKWRELAGRFFIPAIIIVAPYGFWFWYFYQHRLKILAGNAWYFNDQNGTPLLFKAISSCIYDSLHFLTIFGGYLFDVLALSLLAISLFCAIAHASWKAGEKFKLLFFWPSGAVFSLLIFFISFAGLFAAKLFVLRYAIIPAIGLFLLIGYGFVRASRFLKIIVLFFYLILSVLSFYCFNSRAVNIENWRGAADFISQNEQSGDKIVGALYFDLLPMDFYYHGHLPIMAPLDEKYRGDDVLLTTIKTNMYPTTTENNVGQLENYTRGNHRIFLLISDGGGAFLAVPKISEDWLTSQGFVKTAEWPADSGASAYVWLMEKK